MSIYITWGHKYDDVSRLYGFLSRAKNVWNRLQSENAFINSSYNWRTKKVQAPARTFFILLEIAGYAGILCILWMQNLYSSGKTTEVSTNASRARTLPFTLLDRFASSLDADADSSASAAFRCVTLSISAIDVFTSSIPRA